MIRTLEATVFLAQIGETAAPGMIQMFLHTGPMAWFVAGLLIVMSLASWAIMIAKALHLRRAAAQSDAFLEVFRRQRIPTLDRDSPDPHDVLVRPQVDVDLNGVIGLLGDQDVE